MGNNYKTIAEKAEGQYKEKGSKFLAFGFPAADEATVKSLITSIKKEYHDARHHCYAYRIGADPYKYRMNDDGEPSGTAGKPIYGQILAHDLTNILIIVVRYFGGTLLGTSGLMRAYRTAAERMLNQAAILEKTIGVTCNLTFPYNMLSPVMKVIKETGVIYSDPLYENHCSLALNIPKDIMDLFRSKLAVLSGVVCTETGEVPATQSDSSLKIK